MGYADLLKALTDEADRDAVAAREGGTRQAELLVATARAEAAAERDRALGEAEAAERAALARARAAAAREAEATLLREARRRLEALREEAAAALRARARELLPRRIDELCARLAEGPATLLVDAGDEPLAREHLARAHPELAGRVEVRAAAAPSGALELAQVGVVLDDSTDARLERAWGALEPELARMFLGLAAAGEGSRRDGGEGEGD